MTIPRLILAMLLLVPCLQASHPAMPENPGGGNGTTYYVAAESGDDSASGKSEKAAWKTIQKAIDTLEPGDTVLIMNGTYYQRLNGKWENWKVQRSGKPGAYITYRAYPGHNPKLKVDTMNGFLLWSVSYVEVDGLEVFGLPDPASIKGKPINDPARIKIMEDAKYMGNGISVFGPDGWHHVRIVNNKIHDVGGNGIGAANGTLFWVEGNHVWRCSHRSDAGNSGISCIGMRHMGQKPKVYGQVYLNNIVHDCVNYIDFKGYEPRQITDGNGIILDSLNDGNYTHRTLVANNICFDNGGRGIHALKTNHVDVVNNTIWHNLRSEDLKGWDGELSAVKSDDVLFLNNVVVCSSGRKPFNFTEKNVRYENNLLVHDRTDLPALEGNNPKVTAAKLKAAGKRAEAGDFAPAKGSGAIGKGKPFQYVKADFFGQARKAPWDLGAIQVGGISKSASKTASGSAASAKQSDGVADDGEKKAPSAKAKLKEKKEDSMMLVFIGLGVVALVIGISIFAATRKK